MKSVTFPEEPFITSYKQHRNLFLPVAFLMVMALPLMAMLLVVGALALWTPDQATAEFVAPEQTQLVSAAPDPHPSAEDGLIAIWGDGGGKEIVDWSGSNNIVRGLSHS